MENADEKLNYDCFDASMLLEYIRKRQIKIKDHATPFREECV